MDKRVEETDVRTRFYDLLRDGDLKAAGELLERSVEDVPLDELRGPFDTPVRLYEAHEPRTAEEGLIVDTASVLARDLRNARYYLRKMLGQTDVRIVETGDSWHQYPVRLDDLIDHVMQEYAVYSLSAAGATLADIEADIDGLLGAIRSEKPDFLLLSCGGNDILGTPFGQMLRPYSGGAAAESLVNASQLDASIARVIAGHDRICRAALKERPELRILFHGYDYVMPRQEGGSWLKTPLVAKGIPLTIGSDILKIIIDRFNLALDGFAAAFSGSLRYVDLRNSVGPAPGDWHDEIHPGNPGFRRAAARILRALKAPLSAPVRESLTEATSPSIGRWHQLGQNGGLAWPEAGAGGRSRARGNVGRDTAARRERLAEAARNDPDVREAWRHLKDLYDHLNEPEEPERLCNRARYSYIETCRAFERIIGENELDDFFVLERGIKAGRAVARLSVQRDGEGGTRATGFLVGPGLLLTNNHVLPDLRAVRGCIASFDYELTEFGIPKTAHHFRLKEEPFVTSEALDYTFVGVEPFDREGKPLADFGWNPLLPLSGKAVKREYVNIIQHPGGEFKKVVIRENTVMGRKGDFLYYVADTEQGSSGGCVTNVEWQVAALHHMAIPDPQDPEKYVANRGVRISSILHDITVRRQQGDRDARRVDDILDEGRRPRDPLSLRESPAPLPGDAQESAPDDADIAEDEGFSEGLDTEGDLYTPPSRRGLAEAAAKPGELSARWPSDPRNCPDTWHLPADLAGAEFTLTPGVINGLMAVGNYPFPAGNPKLIFSLRGCEIGSGETRVEDVGAVKLRAVRPDHQTFRCLIGVFDRETDMISVYTGSTVPNAWNMRLYFDKVNFGKGKQNCNLLPTGFYDYSVGSHYGGRGEIARVLRLGSGPAVSQASRATVLRTSNDLVYGTADSWDAATPHDNIHPAFSDRGFSSAGCLTLRGTQVPKGSINTATLEWKAFRAKAGFDRAAIGTMYGNLLTTGHEAAAVAAALAADGNLGALLCLRHGSHGDRVTAMQRQIGETDNGDLGASTRRALAIVQDRKLGFATGSWTPEMARLLEMNF